MSEETDQDDMLELTPDAEVEPDDGGAGVHETGADDDGLLVDLDGDEPDPSPNVKRMREHIEELTGELKRYKSATPPAQLTDPGPPPKIEDYDWDGDKHDEAVKVWEGKVRAAAAAQGDAQRRKDQIEASYRTQVAALPVAEYPAFEAKVKAALPEQVFDGIKDLMPADAARVILTLGRNPGRLASIANAPNLAHQILMIGQVQGEMKVKSADRRKPPAPEASTILRGTAAVGSNSETANKKKLDQLEKEAERTGNRNPVLAFKRQLKERAK